MAQIKQGIGMSHSPMMATEGKYWIDFADKDFDHPKLYDETGKHVTYEELSAQRHNRYADEAQPEKMERLFAEMEACFARLKREVAGAAPDVAIIISNDHPGEFLEPSNVPALAVFYGDRIVTSDDCKRENNFKRKFTKLGAIPEAYQQLTAGMSMDTNHVWPGAGAVAAQLIESLMEQQFDVGALKEAADPNRNGHGHGYSMVVRRLMDAQRVIPMVPVYLNTWPPNVLSPSRCYDFGLALRRAVESIPDDIRVTVVASGGLSHFVTDENLDRFVLNALRNRSEHDLRRLPRHLLKAGNCEILNWVVLAGAVEHLNLDWDRYLPVFRTPAGSGIGMTFAHWS